MASEAAPALTGPGPETAAAASDGRRAILGFVALVILAAIVVGIVVTVGGSSDAAGDADSYIASHTGDFGQVQAYMKVATNDLAALNQHRPTPSAAAFSTAAFDVQEKLADVSTNLFLNVATTGPDTIDETYVAQAADDLEGTMEGIASSGGHPDAAGLADVTAQLATSRAEWDHGVIGLWHLAGRQGAPTV